MTSNNDNKNSDKGTELLLAPVDLAQPVTDDEIPESISESESKSESESLESQEIQENNNVNDEFDALKISEEINELQETVKNLENSLEIPEPEINLELESEINNSWHETAAKYNLSLDEPPVELWTKINNPLSDDEDYEKDYKETESLQGDAYIPLPRVEHGKNFTQRLQETLRGRKQRAEILREEEEERKNHHPYLFKSIFLCSAMVIEIALICIALYFLHRYSIMNPKTEKKEIPEQISEQPLQIEIPLPTTGSKIQKEEEEKEESENKEIKIEIPLTSLTFEGLLREGTNAYNMKNYDKAIINFHKAMEMRNYDLRPYIGLAGAYRAKKMYFDSKRILDDARNKFGKNPSIETELKLLMRE